MEVDTFADSQRISSYRRIAFVIAGFPDTSDVFRDNIVPMLDANGYYVIGLTLPGYRGTTVTSVKSQSRQSPCCRWSLQTMVTMFKEAVDSAVEQAPVHCRCEAPLLVCHDWGAIIAFECLTEFPFLFRSIVCLDVAGHVGGDACHHSWSNVSRWLVGKHAAVELKKMICILFYQLWIMCCYLASWLPVSDVSLWLLCQLTHRPVYTDKSGRVVEARAEMGYPYFHLMLGLFSHFPIQTMRFFTPINVPLLYLYGKSKPFQFHSARWLQHLDEKGRRDGVSRACGIDKGHHWFFAETFGPQKEALQHIQTFLSAVQ